MPFTDTPIPGLKIFEPRIFPDDRGYFYESFNDKVFKDAGINETFVQDNQSFSNKYTLRGLHYQLEPFSQAKLVRVVLGEVLDVVVDIRKGSPTFGQSYGIKLSGENHKQLYIPRGFAHGYAVLSDTAMFVYKCDRLYNKAAERGILYNDPDLKIDWQMDLNHAIVSDKDKMNSMFKNAEMNLVLMAKKRVLVTGANGQVGSEIKAISEEYPQFDFVFAVRNDVDIADAGSVNRFFSGRDFDIIINCAAYTAVDKAESDKGNAYRINAEGVVNLVAAGKKNKAILIHISTDFVFDGTKQSPYVETDATNPLGEYGATKLQGEKEALKYENSIIVRTSWVYSSFGNNFVKTMIRLGREKPELRVVNDQQGSPTYARDLAEALLFIASNYSNNNLGQLYHYSNNGDITWYQFAKTILELKHISTPIHPITTAQFPTPAKRPPYSVMDKHKIKHDFPGIPFKDWKDSLQQCLSMME